MSPFQIKKCEDDSNSLLSGGLIDKKVTSFEGILQNGIKAEIDIKEEQVEPKAKKNVLADLLEKTVGGDILNGVVERELRISDRGVEFVNNGQQVKVNGPITSNGQAGAETGQGVKRPATPDNTPAKRIAIEDPRAGTDSRITLYVSQNGNESGEVISQGHQVVLSQGQQLAPTSASGAPQQMVVSQAVLAGQQQGAATQTVVTPQGQVILQRPATQTGMLVQQGGQIIQGATAGQVIQQVIQQGQSGQPQKVILHQGQVLGGQMILSQNSSGQHQVLVQGGNNFQGQVIMQGVPHCQGQVFVQGNNTPGQLVMSSNQGQTVVVSGAHQPQQQVVVSSAQGQAMIVAGNQGQPVVVSGQQGQSGQVMVPSNVGGTVLLAPQQQGSTAKTLIILPNPKMIVSGGQHQGAQGQQLVLPRQVAGQQVVQVVSSSTAGPVPSVSTAVRTVHASTPMVDTRATPTPPPVQIQSSSGGSSSVSVSTYSAQTSATLPAAIAPAPAGPTAVPVSQTSVSVGPQTPHVPAPQVLSSGVARRPGKPSGLQYLCEWRGCNQVFTSAAQVYHHACKIHCPPHIAEIQCGWAGCDPMVRRRFSAMTHLHDRHCNEQVS